MDVVILCLAVALGLFTIGFVIAAAHLPDPERQYASDERRGIVDDNNGN